MDYYPRDSTLFISYEIDGEEYKYYQSVYDRFLSFDAIEYSESQHLFCYSNSINFGILATNTSTVFSWGDVIIDFWNKDILDKSVVYYKNNLSNTLETNYNYKCPPSPLSIADTSFMCGINLSINAFNNYSTEHVMDYYEYNIDSINHFFNDESYFNISSVESVCGKYFLVKGTFSTKIMHERAPYDVKIVNKGNFTFITE